MIATESDQKFGCADEWLEIIFIFNLELLEALPLRARLKAAVEASHPQPLLLAPRWGPR